MNQAGNPDDIHVNVNLIPQWVADDLAACLYRNIVNYFSVPENQAKFEKWKAERDRKAAEAAANAD